MPWFQVPMRKITAEYGRITVEADNVTLAVEKAERTACDELFLYDNTEVQKWEQQPFAKVIEVDEEKE